MQKRSRRRKSASRFAIGSSSEIFSTPIIFQSCLMYHCITATRQHSNLLRTRHAYKFEDEAQCVQRRSASCSSSNRTFLVERCFAASRMICLPHVISSSYLCVLRLSSSARSHHQPTCIGSSHQRGCEGRSVKVKLQSEVLDSSLSSNGFIEQLMMPALTYYTVLVSSSQRSCRKCGAPPLHARMRMQVQIRILELCYMYMQLGKRCSVAS